MELESRIQTYQIINTDKNAFYIDILKRKKIT